MLHAVRRTLERHALHRTTLHCTTPHCTAALLHCRWQALLQMGRATEARELKSLPPSAQRAKEALGDDACMHGRRAAACRECVCNPSRAAPPRRRRPAVLWLLAIAARSSVATWSVVACSAASARSHCCCAVPAVRR